jgi:hypothetical protein
MPNVQPWDLPIQEPKAVHYEMAKSPGPCSNGPCFDIKEDTGRGGFLFTSTLHPGGQFYDYGEVAKLFRDIDAGFLAEVRATAERHAVTATV